MPTLLWGSLAGPFLCGRHMRCLDYSLGKFMNKNENQFAIAHFTTKCPTSSMAVFFELRGPMAVYINLLELEIWKKLLLAQRSFFREFLL